MGAGPRSNCAGDDYSVADMATYPWYGNMVRGAYGTTELLSA
jgi:hypothetical protein